MHIRRIASPFTPYQEDLFDENYKETQRRKRREHQKELEKPSSILIGSIKGINTQVCEFETQLSSYDSRLTIQSRQAGDVRQRNIKSRDGIAFEDKYQENLKNDSSCTRKPKETKKKDIAEKGPRLMELQQYPGFQRSPTDLPHSVTIKTINNKVVGALTHLNAKPTYKRLFEKAIATNHHQNLMKDFFWWIFLQKSSPDVDVQAKLFKRIAKHYGWFFMDCGSQRFRDVFFMDYPELVAQSLYSSFCHCFPQSWKQFDDEDFKNLLSRVTNLWIAGIRPHPRSYLKWNKLLLEPANMREGQSFKSKGNKKKTVKSPVGVRNCDKFSSQTSSIAITSQRSIHSKFDDANNVVSFKPIGKSASVLQPILKQREVQKKNVGESSAVNSHEMRFGHSKFNLNGRSPLLSEFMHQFGKKKPGKADILVSCTQVISFPKPNCRSLDDVITESQRLTSITRKGFENILTDGEEAFREFKTKQQEDKKILDRKAKKLLEDRDRTTLLSNLVMAELKKDPTAIPSEAQRAIWLAVVADTSTDN